jgi:hypothetical protein
MLVLDLGRNTVYALDPQGGMIWERLAEAPATAEELGQTAGADAGAVEAFLARLCELELAACQDGLHRPLDASEPAAAGPRILWSEELRKVVGYCLKQPFNDACVSGGGPLYNS